MHQMSYAHRPDSPILKLGPDFHDAVAPADFPGAVIRFRNQPLAERLGLGGLDEAGWRSHFSRFEALPGALAEPLALRYHGHQFRSYNPELGDGRGFLFAQLREATGDRLVDLSTKGSGQTPFSRSGDGRLTLKGAVREALATAMLRAQGVNTSETLSVIETGEALSRHDEPSPTRGAVLVRRTHSSIRFGTFQRHAFHDRPDLILRLVEHVIETYQPDLQGEADPTAAFFRRVCELSAHLAADWMSAGFVHGVLNTDNMNINGESFDYGPYRFLPKSDPNFVAAYFDHNGLYAFGRQPEAVYWNLSQLAGCLLGLTTEGALSAALEGFAADYRRALGRRIAMRLGLKPKGDEDNAALAAAAFALLAEGADALRWEPLFFDWRGGAASTGRALAGPRRDLYCGEKAHQFRRRLAEFEAHSPQILAHPYFEETEPQELLYPEIEAIWARISDADDWSAFDAKIADLGRMEAALRLN